MPLETLFDVGFAECGFFITSRPSASHQVLKSTPPGRSALEVGVEDLLELRFVVDGVPDGGVQ